MKRLYISDLDGTLLDSNAKVTDFTAETINALIDKGMYFTFATARSVYSAKPITSAVKINVPCILMNGVSIYDIGRDIYVSNRFIGRSTSEKIIEAFEKNGVKCFMYKIHCGVLTACFTEITSRVMYSFAEVRKNKYYKPFVQYRTLEEAADDEVVYYTTTGGYEELLPVKSEIDLIEEADCAFYEDIYNRKWYLEIFSKDASKYNGVKLLRENYGFDEIVCFGDNLNDIPMFRASDIRVAVANAKDEVRSQADFTALSNNEDGVARWLLENYKF